MNSILEADVKVDAVHLRESVWRSRVSQNSSYCWPATATAPCRGRKKDSRFASLLAVACVQKKKKLDHEQMAKTFAVKN
jgi:hypothetical protein